MKSDDQKALNAFKRSALDRGYKYASLAHQGEEDLSVAIRTLIAEAYMSGALEYSEEFKALKAKLNSN